VSSSGSICAYAGGATGERERTGEAMAFVPGSRRLKEDDRSLISSSTVMIRWMVESLGAVDIRWTVQIESWCTSSSH
jgi:hypothetical protein